MARIDETLPGVDTETIATETLVLLLPQAWDSDPTRTDLPWDGLSDVPLIVPPAGSASRNRLDRFSNQIGITVNAFLENANRWMSIEMVRSGVAAFLVSQASEITIPGVAQKRLVPTETSEVGIVHSTRSAHLGDFRIRRGGTGLGQGRSRQSTAIMLIDSDYVSLRLSRASRIDNVLEIGLCPRFCSGDVRVEEHRGRRGTDRQLESRRPKLDPMPARDEWISSDYGT